MDDLTAAQARAYDAWFDTSWGAHAWAVERGAVEEALPGLADQIVVEVGCGTGRLVHHLAGRGARVLGVDARGLATRPATFNCQLRAEMSGIGPWFRL